VTGASNAGERCTRVNVVYVGREGGIYGRDCGGRGLGTGNRWSGSGVSRNRNSVLRVDGKCRAGEGQRTEDGFDECLHWAFICKQGPGHEWKSCRIFCLIS
jgi:hypothetical protein